MAVKTKKKTSSDQQHSKWPFGTRNYLVFALALVVIIIGYVTLGQGSITLAPILLVLGYCVLIPVALIIRGEPEHKRSGNEHMQHTGD